MDTSVIWTLFYYGQFTRSETDKNSYKFYLCYMDTSIIQRVSPVSLVSILRWFECTQVWLHNYHTVTYSTGGLVTYRWRYQLASWGGRPVPQEKPHWRRRGGWTQAAWRSCRGSVSRSTCARDCTLSRSTRGFSRWASPSGLGCDGPWMSERAVVHGRLSRGAGRSLALFLSWCRTRSRSSFHLNLMRRCVECLVFY